MFVSSFIHSEHGVLEQWARIFSDLSHRMNGTPFLCCHLRRAENLRTRKHHVTLQEYSIFYKQIIHYLSIVQGPRERRLFLSSVPPARLLYSNVNRGGEIPNHADLI